MEGRSTVANKLVAAAEQTSCGVATLDGIEGAMRLRPRGDRSEGAGVEAIRADTGASSLPPLVDQESSGFSQPVPCEMHPLVEGGSGAQGGSEGYKAQMPV